jgi:hypothetical protein
MFRICHNSKLVKEAGARVMEANLSCPNEGSAHLLCFDLERTKKIAYALRMKLKYTSYFKTFLPINQPNDLFTNWAVWFRLCNNKYYRS